MAIISVFVKIFKDAIKDFYLIIYFRMLVVHLDR